MKVLLYGGPIFTGLELQSQNDLAVLIEGSQISAVGKASELLPANTDAEIIDLQGRTLMPGMVDAHRHMIGLTDVVVDTDLIVTGAIEGVWVAINTLRSGITTVRDPGCKHMGVFTLKRMINEGFIPGPHVYAAGPNPTGTAAPEGWRNVWVDGETEIRHAVRELKRKGVDWIKFVFSCQSRTDLWSRTEKFLTFEELKAGVEEAHEYGYRVSGHVEGLEGAQQAVAAGFDAIEHGTVIDEDLAKVMVEKGVFYVPTLYAFNTMTVQEEPLKPHEQIAYDARAAEHKRSFQRALAAGVKIAVGTDMYRQPPSDVFVNEMRMLTKFGMSNAQALQAATVRGAELLGEEKIFGSLSQGLRADMIVVNGDPLQDLGALLHIDLVIKSGQKMAI